MARTKDPFKANKERVWGVEVHRQSEGYLTLRVMAADRYSAEKLALEAAPRLAELLPPLKKETVRVSTCKVYMDGDQDSLPDA